MINLPEIVEGGGGGMAQFLFSFEASEPSELSDALGVASDWMFISCTTGASSSLTGLDPPATIK